MDSTHIYFCILRRKRPRRPGLYWNECSLTGTLVQPHQQEKETGIKPCGFAIDSFDSNSTFCTKRSNSISDFQIFQEEVLTHIIHIRKKENKCHYNRRSLKNDFCISPLSTTVTSNLATKMGHYFFLNCWWNTSSSSRYSILPYSSSR